MRESVRDKGRLEHILQAIANVMEFMKNVDFDELLNNKILFFAIVKNIEIIGEASYKLSKEFKAINNNVEWDAIIGMRHVLVHGYYHINEERVWKIIQKDLMPFKKQIQMLYDNEI
jgi:uncharacterized protein with HEPN domain